VGLESAAGSKLKKMVCKGDPLSTFQLVKVGGRNALGVDYITRFVAVTSCPSACCSLLCLLLAPSCAWMFYSSFLSVVQRMINGGNGMDGMGSTLLASMYPKACPIIPEDGTVQCQCKFAHVLMHHLRAAWHPPEAYLQRRRVCNRS
jgi:hypothetical protein